MRLPLLCYRNEAAGFDDTHLRGQLSNYILTFLFVFSSASHRQSFRLPEEGNGEGKEIVGGWKLNKYDRMEGNVYEGSLIKRGISGNRISPGEE